MTVPEFLEWADSPMGGAGASWQLRDGEPEMMAPAAEAHGAIQAELARLIGNHLAETGRRCRVVTEPGVVPRIRSERNMLVPDLGVTCAPPVAGAVTMAEPLLVVEILSPSNTRATRANLWAFASVPSVAEILVVSSVAVAAEVLRRGPGGDWPERPETLGEEGALRLDSIGFEAPLRALYRTTALGEGG
jgi:Uma2 family endonuclease